VEFGLIRRPEGLRVYGAGILSSFGETQFALESNSPNRLSFNLRRVMRTQYRIDDFQQTYFVIDSFGDLLRQTLETDFAPLYTDLAGSDSYSVDALFQSDDVISPGTQEYVRNEAANA
jgi:phenylalanine-4-hydroxylase